MKVLVLGSTGMAGHMIASYLTDVGFEVTTAARAHWAKGVHYHFELNSQWAMMPLPDEDYDAVINCIGILAPDAERDVSDTYMINAWFPHYLEDYYKDTKTKVIHISTDCVFDGKRGYYIEKDIPNETNNYGRSKAAGEIINDKDYTLRVSIIGPEIKEHNRSGLFNWITSTEEKYVSGWANAWWNGLTTLELARCIEFVLKESIPPGLYHPTDNDIYINKWELLAIIIEVWNLDVELKWSLGPKEVNKILMNTSGVKFPVKPYWSQLIDLRNYIDGK